jgi:signal-transduction protein with cAMP-binding, CBS, and nucleotidyltransferase domain
VPVHAPGRQYGLISERDLVTALAASGDPQSLPAADVMTTELFTAKPTASIVEVGTRMPDTGIRHVVLRDRDRIVGIVSSRDVLRAMLFQWTPRLSMMPLSGPLRRPPTRSVTVIGDDTVGHRPL